MYAASLAVNGWFHFDFILRDRKFIGTDIEDCVTSVTVSAWKIPVQTRTSAQVKRNGYNSISIYHAM